MSVLLIGNSDINKDKKYGNKIDEFDIVVRMNRYKIEGYEEYLGTKTNTWVLNRAISLGKSRMPLLERMRADGTWYGHHDEVISDKFDMNKKISEDLDEILLITYVSNHGEIVNLHNKVQKHKNFKVADTWEVSKHLRSRWDELMSKTFYKPATGLLTIHYFLEKYDKIYLHNFDCGKTKHYWGDTDFASEPMSSKHDWGFDEILIAELEKEEKVIQL
jgi:hypothetical protein